MCKYVDELKKVNYSKNKINQIATKFGLKDSELKQYYQTRFFKNIADVVDLEVLSQTNLEEIEKLLEVHNNVAKHYYPYFFDKTILTEQDIKQKFKENSVLLLSSSNLYIEKNFIEMPEVNKINEFINKDEYQKTN